MKVRTLGSTGGVLALSTIGYIRAVVNLWIKVDPLLVLCKPRMKLPGGYKGLRRQPLNYTEKDQSEEEAPTNLSQNIYLLDRITGKQSDSGDTQT